MKVNVFDEADGFDGVNEVDRFDRVNEVDGVNKVDKVSRVDEVGRVDRVNGVNSTVGMWCSFVIIHVVMIRKRWQPARQQLLHGITSLATLCIYRP
jgi:hypothetical protein